MANPKYGRLKIVSMALKDSLAGYQVTVSDKSIGLIARDLTKSVRDCSPGCTHDCKDGCVNGCKDSRKG